MIVGQISKGEVGPCQSGVGHEGQGRVPHEHTAQAGQVGEGGELDVADGVLVQVQHLQRRQAEVVVVDGADAVPGEVELRQRRQVVEGRWHVAEQGLVQV